MVKIRLLGPWQVCLSDRPVAVTGRPRVVLAALALAGDGGVSIESLIRYCWGERLPQRPRPALQSVVVRLRDAIGPDVVRTGADGYTLTTHLSWVDVARFHELVDRAAGAQGRHRDEREALGQALELWRGEPLAGVGSDELLAEAAPRLDDERTAAVLRRIDLDLAAGRHPELIAELRELTTRHPLREAFWLRLLTALNRSGRRADALAAYRRVESTLRDELGIDPGNELQDYHRALLLDESDQPPPGAITMGRALGERERVPAQLPAAVSGFVGRRRELDELDALLAGAVPAAVVSGTPGVGKTSLAVHWAHRVRERFRDGQMYVNLHGYSPHGQVGAAEALAGFLRELGVDNASIPAEPAERAARFRSLLDGRQVLLVLDNAATVEQVRPLLPGAASCFTVVTSRTPLAGLVAREGAGRVMLDLPSEAESLQLLQGRIGGRAAAPAAARQIVSLCARLPLALQVVAERARATPDGLDALAVELADEQRRLDLLDADGDPDTAVRAVFSWSFRHLDAFAARLFRLMSLHAGRDIDAHALTAMADSDHQSVRRSLDQLTRAHLVTETTGGSYTMHDLLRDYGSELARELDDDNGRRAAMWRLFSYYSSRTTGTRHRRRHDL